MKTLLLSGFEADKGLAERIPDDLLHDWIVFAIKKGLEVTVFLDTSFHKAGREIEGLTSRGLTLRNIDWQPHPELDQMSLGDQTS